MEKNKCNHEEECEITSLGSPEEEWLCIDCGRVRTEPHGHVCLDFNCECYGE